MNLATRSLAGLLVTLLVAAQAWSDQDSIPVITWKPGDPTTIDFYFHNQVHSGPSRKVLQFVGEATSLLQAPTTFDIQVYFDYVDANGVTVLIPSPPFGYNNVTPADTQIHHIEGGPYVLDFCPSEVSIHFEIASEVPIEFQGRYDHTCVPVPEPSTIAFCAIGAMGSLVVRRRRWLQKPMLG